MERRKSKWGEEKQMGSQKASRGTNIVVGQKGRSHTRERFKREEKTMLVMSQDAISWKGSFSTFRFSLCWWIVIEHWGAKCEADKRWQCIALRPKEALTRTVTEFKWKRLNLFLLSPTSGQRSNNEGTNLKEKFKYWELASLLFSCGTWVKSSPVLWRLSPLLLFLLPAHCILSLKIFPLSSLFPTPTQPNT